ncbi:MFS transporter [Belnapia sp. T18]|uniref:MFS transporter n=1 Tax=Belnapia arida TaxID=2804533 RepID=A0ABS1U283_9PROT|nr:MFS transporter [Belnapia arida]MBL6077797.1 MFS transporter [Belnapia arida]
MPYPAHAVPLVGLAIGAVGLATTIPLPLYGEMAARGGYGAGALALAFACYAATVIVTAPLLGPLPDRIGRKPCVLLGVALAALSSLALSLWPSIPALALARVAQGLGMGCVAGAAAAWGAELGGGGPEGGRRAAGVIALATIGSFGAGGILTLAAILAWPALRPPPTFALHIGICLVLLALAARLPETLAVPQQGWLRRPGFPRGTLATTCAILPGWGVTGTVLTAVQSTLAASGRPLAGPFAACGMMLIGVIAQRGFRQVAPRRAVRIGLGVLLLGAGLTFLGAAGWGMAPLLLGGAVVGIGTYGFVYPGGLAAVAEAASGEERARAVAGYFVLAHLGFGAVPLTVGLGIDAFGAGPALAGSWLALLLAACLLWWVTSRSG